MTMVALLLPWFVVHGVAMPPIQPFVVALVAAAGAALLIVIVVNGFGVARFRLVTSMFWWCSCCSFTAWARFGIPAVPGTKKVIHLLDRSYSARPLAQRLDTIAPPNETVAVFRVRRDMEYGLSFYRNREVVNYEESGVPDEQHLLVARVTGRNGVDLHTPAALEEYLEGRHYEELFSWPEQGLEVYLVGRSVKPNRLQNRRQFRGCTTSCLMAQLPHGLTCSRCRSEGHSMTSGVSLEILDLRHFSATMLRPLLEAEASVWRERLHWDYSASSRLLMQYLDSHMLPGYAAVDAGRITGYAFCVYEENKAVIGDVFAMSGNQSAASPIPPSMAIRKHREE